MDKLAIIFGLTSGLCLAAISLRWYSKKDLPMIGTIMSPKLHEKLDPIDKHLALLAGISFSLCILFFFLSM